METLQLQSPTPHPLTAIRKHKWWILGGLLILLIAIGGFTIRRKIKQAERKASRLQNENEELYGMLKEAAATVDTVKSEREANANTVTPNSEKAAQYVLPVLPVTLQYKIQPLPAAGHVTAFRVIHSKHPFYIDCVLDRSATEPGWVCGLHDMAGKMMKTDVLPLSGVNYPDGRAMNSLLLHMFTVDTETI